MADATDQNTLAPPLQGSALTQEKNTAILSGESTHSDASDKAAIILIPKPSDDPRDPLNWPLKKKLVLGLTLCFCLFIGFSAPFNGQIQIAQQAALYGKTTVQITYFNSAASGGLAAGCWVWWVLAKKIGRCAVIFWTMVGVLATQIWACYMRSPNDYNGFMAAKFFMGFFGQTLAILGPLYVVDLFFLHERGRAFNCLGIAMNIGASAGPTFSGFITVKLAWWNEYWWTIAASAFCLVLILLFVEETSWDRTPGAQNEPLTGTWLQRRIKTFFPGTATLQRSPTSKELIDAFVNPFKIALSPVILLCSGFDAVTFGFWVALNALTPVWLQKPVIAGGYGFSVLDNAAFTTVHWMTLILSQLYGHMLADRIPLWLCARNDGKWKPEFRLHALWIPNFVLTPIGLGLVGCALQYHLHWVVMAVGNFLVTFGAMQGIPVTMNYVAECFRNSTVEAVIPLSSMRLFFGLSINFYINAWITAVGIGWVYGMMAFFCAGCFGFLVILMWKGHEIRQASPFHTAASEEGEKVLGKKTADLTVA
ncbi:major facilitator superfamily domain-containing protein [Xylariales sp. PMI_506]|nr:major facilitator superfamily domain-containing protein [Xylariales sp. PMI_506]